MDAQRINAFVHLFSTILLTGLALFWLIMATALKQRFDASRTAELLATLNRARWPHVIVPWGLRLPLPLLSWALLALLAITGAFAFHWRYSQGIAQLATPQWIKLVGVGLLLLVQAALAFKPSPGMIRINFTLVLIVALVSIWMIR